ncbi:MAG: acetyltransferase [Planctomycetota bacterium]|nr:MAG: acetyltransferase [Planctomycetota bacterium]
MTMQIFTGDVERFCGQQASIRSSTILGSGVAVRSPTTVERWLIVGAGGFGREVYSWTLGQLHAAGTNPRVGFLDDDATVLDKFPELKRLWVGRISDYEPQSGDRLLMAIGDPSAKLAVAEQLTARGGRFVSYIHPTAVLASDVQVGVGVIICPSVVICCNVRLGDFVLMNVGALAGHDSMIGDGCTLSPHADVTGQVVLERGVFLGCRAVILPKIHVGEFSRVGAGSVVISQVKPRVTMMGVPAKRIDWLQKDDDEQLQAG